MARIDPTTGLAHDAELGPAAPTPPHPAALRLALVAVGVAWGSTGPISKLAVSTGHHPIGVTFWNTAICAVVLTALTLATGRRLPVGARAIGFFLICGLLGTALPNTLAFAAYSRLPVGVIMIVISLVPMATLLLALPLGLERPEPRRLLGLGLGAAAVMMIALPEASLPDPSQAVWVALPVIVALSYAAENVFIAMALPRGCDALSTICGLSWGALLLLTPVMIAADAWVPIQRLGPPELAIPAIATLHILAYTGFVWLIGQGGPVYASLVGYVVTGVGVALGMLVYGERHSPWIWAALAMMVLGLALVKPRR